MHITQHNAKIGRSIGAMVFALSLILPWKETNAMTNSAVNSTPETNYIIVHGDTRKEKSIENLATELKDMDVIFFGEYHDQDILHKIELQLFKDLEEIKKDKLVLSLEMIEADNQKLLDEYLAGKASLNDFMVKSRPWPNYTKDYGPMVEIAKEHKLPVIASNIPRFMAAKLAKENTVEGLESKYKALLPKKTYAPEGRYREKFMAHMSVNNGPMPIAKERLEQIFKAQCLKDAKMAESIAEGKKKYPDRLIFHVNGCFHSDGHLGTAEALKNLSPKLRVAVITPKDIPTNMHYAEDLVLDKADGEYVIYFIREKKDKK